MSRTAPSAWHYHVDPGMAGRRASAHVRTDGGTSRFERVGLRRPAVVLRPARPGLIGLAGFGPPVMLPVASPPMTQPSTVPIRFDVLETIGPKQSNFELAATIVAVSVAVVPASVHKPPPSFAEFFVIGDVIEHEDAARLELDAAALALLVAADGAVRDRDRTDARIRDRRPRSSLLLPEIVQSEKVTVTPLSESIPRPCRRRCSWRSSSGGPSPFPPERTRGRRRRSLRRFVLA